LCYWSIASVVEADYYYLLGTEEEVVDDVNDSRDFLENISVDPAALEGALDTMIL
jgi:hypothetical protein